MTSRTPSNFGHPECLPKPFARTKPFARFVMFALFCCLLATVSFVIRDTAWQPASQSARTRKMQLPVLRSYRTKPVEEEELPFKDDHQIGLHHQQERGIEFKTKHATCHLHDRQTHTHTRTRHKTHQTHLQPVAGRPPDTSNGGI